MRQRRITKTVTDIFQNYVQVLAKEPVWNYNDVVMLERRFFFKTDRAYYTAPYLILHVRRPLWFDRFMVLRMDKDLSERPNRLRVMPAVLQWFGEGCPKGGTNPSQALRTLSEHGSVVLPNEADWSVLGRLLEDKRERFKDIMRPKLSNGRFLLEHVLLDKPCPNCGIELDVVAKHLTVMDCDACGESLVMVREDSETQMISTEVQSDRQLL